MKKALEMLGLLSLILFSFFYTSKISTVIKENDDIMIQINEIKEQYKITALDAIIENDTIIPGLSGSEIDVENSYKKMKKINYFNPNLLVYKTVKSNITIDKVYDKYIISGNKNKKMATLLFLLDYNDNINDIIKILDKNNVKATFFTSEDWFSNNNQKIIDLIKNNHTIGILDLNNNYKGESINWMNTVIKKIGKQNYTYCYNILSKEALNMCNKYMSYTIRPSIIIKSNPLIEVKNNLENGSIISLNVNNKVLQELPLIINYIESKGLEITNLEKLLEE